MRAHRKKNLLVEGRDLHGAHFAMEYLCQQNRVNRGMTYSPEGRIDAAGKRVIVLGGDDTGADCVGTPNRQGAASIKQVELLLKPPAERNFNNPCPQWTRIYRQSTSHDKDIEQDFCVMMTHFSGNESS